jgi:hypothetical protein
MDVNLQQEWSNVSGSPLIFLGTVLLSWIVIWLIQRHFHRTQIDNLESRLRLRDDEIARLERNAAAPTGSAIITVEKAPAPQKRARPAPAPIPIAKPVPQVQREGRIFVGPNVTIGFLTGMYANVTSAQAARAVAAYVGKWMKISAPISNVYADGTVVIEVPDAKSIITMLEFSSNREELEILHVGDILNAIGRLDRINRYDVTLVDCELVTSG